MSLTGKLRLSREIRFALAPSSTTEEGIPRNSWAGWPSTNRVVPHLVLQCVVEGEPDPKTGFLCNVKAIDGLLRSIVTGRSMSTATPSTAEELVQVVYQELLEHWDHESTIVSVCLALSPFLCYSIVAENKMNLSSDQHIVQLTEQFEFSAAHRLHCQELSDEENQQLFGKCNNLAGHGHNYVFEVTVSDQLDSRRGTVIELEEFESIVKRLVVDRLDHKHLNEDIEYFAMINPTVENIAIAIFNWLSNQFGEVKLEKVKVFETPKTWAEFCG